MRPRRKSPKRSAANTALFGMHLTPHVVRRVWAAVTKEPCATVRALGVDLGMGYSTIATALRMLRDAGYIEFDPTLARARTIIVPFIVRPIVIKKPTAGAQSTARESTPVGR